MSRGLVFLLSVILVIAGCQSSGRKDQFKPAGLIGGDLALSTERLARMCRQDSDCVGFKHPCGHLVPVLKWEYDDFVENWREENRNRKFNCERFKKGGDIICDAGACVNSKTI